VLVRYLSQLTLKNYVRITVGSAEQMRVLMRESEAILKEARV